MKHYLVVFDRQRGTLVSVEAFETARAAMDARFDAEHIHRADGDIEVVVLGARSEEALHSTHARYFSAVRDLVKRGASLLPSNAA